MKYPNSSQWLQNFGWFLGRGHGSGGDAVIEGGSGQVVGDLTVSVKESEFSPVSHEKFEAKKK